MSYKILRGQILRSAVGVVLLLAVGLASTNCAAKKEDAPASNAATSTSTTSTTVTSTTTSTTSVVQKGSRQIGMDVLTTTPSSDFNNNIALAKAFGTSALQINLAWSLYESGGTYNCVPGSYVDAYGVAALNTILPGQGLKLLLTLNPLTTNIWMLPSIYSSSDFTADSSLVATQNKIDQIACRFNNFVDYVFTLIPNVEIVSLQIGNEIEISPEAQTPHFWSNYWRFYANVATHARTIRTTAVTTAMKIGTTASLDGLTGAYGSIPKSGLSTLNGTISDVIAVNYYGGFVSGSNIKSPDTVTADFTALLAEYTDATKKIHFQEVGFHSGATHSGSSEAKQATFYSNVFKEWDKYPSRIPFIAFLRMNDLSHTAAQSLGDGYFPPTAPADFVEYLETLGIRTYAGADKPAYTTIKSEAAARGW